jgi:hypothetical protein
LLLGDTSFATVEPKFDCRRTVRKVGSASACAFASRFFLARPAGRFRNSDLAIVLASAVAANLRSCRCRRAALAAKRSCAPLPSRASGFWGVDDD